LYCKPGFEARSSNKQAKGVESLMLGAEFRSLTKSLAQEDLAVISSIARIEQRVGRNPQESLVDLEHAHLNAALRKDSRIQLKGKKAMADHWWANVYPLTWCAEVQRLTPFRKSSPDEAFVLYQEDETEPAQFCVVSELGELIPKQSDFEQTDITFSLNAQPWLETKMETLLATQAEKLEQDVASISKRFGEIRLRKPGSNSLDKWLYHPWLGVYRAMK